MKKSLFVIIPTLIILVGGAVYIMYNNTDKEEEKTKQEINKEEQTKEFVFETAEGTVEFDAEQALTPRGFAGTTNHIFYLKDNNLYYYIHNEEAELYAEGVEKIYYETDTSEEIVVKLKENAKIIKTSNYLLYLKENEKIFTFETAYEPSTVKIVATKATNLSGFAGATSHIFYIKDNNLYEYVHEGEDELLVENALDVSFDIKKIEALLVKIDENSKIIKDSQYAKYIKEGEQIFTFSTAYEPSQVKIIAKEALTPRGFSGSSNHIFYLKDNKLYYYNHEGEDELYAIGVEKIYHESKQSEEVVVKLNKNSEIIKESSYLIYK